MLDKSEIKLLFRRYGRPRCLRHVGKLHVHMGSLFWVFFPMCCFWLGLLTSHVTCLFEPKKNRTSKQATGKNPTRTVISILVAKHGGTNEKFWKSIFLPGLLLSKLFSTKKQKPFCRGSSTLFVNPKLVKAFFSCFRIKLCLKMSHNMLSLAFIYTTTKHLFHGFGKCLNILEIFYSRFLIHWVGKFVRF